MVDKSAKEEILFYPLTIQQEEEEEVAFSFWRD